MADLYPNANKKVAFGCFWQGGCGDSVRCNQRGSCVAAAQKQSIDVTREYHLAGIAANDFNPGEQPDIGKLMKSAYTHGYAQALIDSKTDREEKP